MATSTARTPSRSSKASRPCGVGPACTSARPTYRGLHHLVWEIVDNSIDEAMAGHATHIEIRIQPDGSLRNTDNGRGVPVGMQKQTGRDALEVVHTVLHAGGKFGGGGYKVSGGLHGVGVSVVNALSEWLTRRDRPRWQGLGPGVPSRRPGRTGPAHRSVAWPPRHDHRVHARQPGVRHHRLQLRHHRPACPGVRVPDQGRPHPPRGRAQSIRSARSPSMFEGGIASFVRHLNKDRETLGNRPIAIERKDGTTSIEVAIQYNDGYAETVLAFANNIHTSTAAPTSRASVRRSPAASTTGRDARGSSRTPRTTCRATMSGRD